MRAPGVHWDWVWDPTWAGDRTRPLVWANGHHSYLPSGGEGRKTATPVGDWWDRIPTVKAAAVAAVLVGVYYVYATEFSPYALGRKAVVRHVREMAAKGVFVRAGMNFDNALDLIPADPNASPDWNAGFRAGFKEKLERMYYRPRQ